MPSPSHTTPLLTPLFLPISVVLFSGSISNPLLCSHSHSHLSSDPPTCNHKTRTGQKNGRPRLHKMDAKELPRLQPVAVAMAIGFISKYVHAYTATAYARDIYFVCTKKLSFCYYHNSIWCVFITVQTYYIYYIYIYIYIYI